MKMQLTLLSAVVALTLAACSSIPNRNANVEDARLAVNQASGSTEVTRLAQSELARAREALNRADTAWSERRDDAETAHLAYLAYLANQRAQIAMNLAAQRAADQRVAEASAERQTDHGMVEGYTDSTGSEESNIALSQARAEAVRAALITKGVAVDRIDVRGDGESRPVASNATAAGRQQNRRVEVVFSDTRGQFAAMR